MRKVSDPAASPNRPIAGARGEPSRRCPLLQSREPPRKKGSAAARLRFWPIKSAAMMELLLGPLAVQATSAAAASSP